MLTKLGIGGGGGDGGGESKKQKLKKKFPYFFIYYFAINCFVFSVSLFSVFSFFGGSLAPGRSGATVPQCQS